ncbi:MAG: VWA domain-containing protein [Kofleriaceae bacterium]|nr:VWA domain-containing protein [Kofleriaceae bacterium]
MTDPSAPLASGQWHRRHRPRWRLSLGGAQRRRHRKSAGAPSSSPPAAIASPGTGTLTGGPGPIALAEPVRDTVVDTVQIALILDTSSSMDSLINQARSHLWKMVDDLGRMTRVVDGKVRGVRVEIALYEYGNSSVPATDGYIRQVLPLSGDLDLVSEKLHGLFTNGGSEYAGQAIVTAVTSLEWSSDPSALRFIFLAGNESFDQGPIAAAAAMKQAGDKDITVQLIHAGGEGRAGGRPRSWRSRTS